MTSPHDIAAEPEAGGPVSADAGAALFEAHLFGPFRLDAANGSSSMPSGRKARVVLALVLLAGGTPVARERLCALLWADRGEEQARASLRQTLYEMRALSAGECPLLIQERTHLRLVPAHVRTDLERLRQLAAAGDADGLAGALGYPLADLLCDLDGIAPEVDEWLATERLRRGDERRRLVLEAATVALADDRVEAARRLATALLAFEATDEGATRLALEACQRLGDRDGARQAFARLDKALRTEVGVMPSAETSALYQRVMATAAPPLPDTPGAAAASPPPLAESGPAVAVAHLISARAESRRHGGWIIATAALVSVAVVGFWWTHTHTHTPAPAHRVILVQPLRVAQGDADAQALRNGLAADLARMLVGHDASLTVADSGDRAATAMSADFVLTGEVQTAAAQLHAAIKLSGGKDAAILWSSTFTRPVAELDALREQISSKIADVAGCALGGHHPAPEQLDLETTRLYLAACEQKHGDWKESVHLLQQVVARNPGFAHGWAMLAAGTATNAGLLPDDEVPAAYRDADAAARRALALDPKDGEAIYARASTLPGLRHWAERIALLEHGHAVDPDNGVITGTLAWNLALVGRLHEATMLARQAVDADPYSALDVAFLAELVRMGGDPREAAELLAAAQRRFPLVPQVRRTDFRIAALSGDASRANRMLDDGPGRLVLAPASQAVWRAVLAARIDASSAHVDAAVRAIESADAADPDIGLRTIERLAAVGRVDEARRFARTSRAADIDNENQSVLFSKLLQPVRADRGFIPLAGRQGLVAIWQASGRWPDFCDDKTLPYDCKAEAARLASSSGR